MRGVVRRFVYWTRLPESMDIQEVARRARVSPATVSRVLNRVSMVKAETAAHVLRVIAELNYVPNTSARSLRVGRSKLFGLVVSDINNPFFPELIDGFEAMAAERGIDVIFTHTNYDTKRLQACLRRLVERNVEGIAVMTSELAAEALEPARRSGVPLVVLNQTGLDPLVHNIWVDYTSGFEEAVAHLRGLGHRDIAFVAGPPRFSSAERRREAFAAAMKRYGLPVSRKRVVVGDLRVEGGYAAARTLLAGRPRPTAIVTTNDLMAVGALQAAQEAGVAVPGELSIVGFDDLPVCTMVRPRLTTIALSRREIARCAFGMLYEEAGVARQEGVVPRLVVRESTAGARVGG